MDCACPALMKDKANVGRFFNIKNARNESTGKHFSGNDCFSISLLHLFMNSVKFLDYLTNLTPNERQMMPITKVFEQFRQGFIKHPCKLPEEVEEKKWFPWKNKDVIEQPMAPKDLLELIPPYKRYKKTWWKFFVELL